MTAVVLATPPSVATFEAAGFSPAEASLLVEAFAAGNPEASSFAVQAVAVRESAGRFLALTARALGRPS